MANQSQKAQAKLNRKKTIGRNVDSSKERAAHGRKPYKSLGNPFKREIVYEKPTGSVVPLAK